MRSSFGPATLSEEPQPTDRDHSRGIVKLSQVGAVANHISLMRHI